MNVDAYLCCCIKIPGRKVKKGKLQFVRTLKDRVDSPLIACYGIQTEAYLERRSACTLVAKKRKGWSFKLHAISVVRVQVHAIILAF